MCYLRFPVFQKIPEEIRKQKSMKDIRLMHVLAKLDRETLSFCCFWFLPFPLQCYSSVETMEQKPGNRHPVTRLSCGSQPRALSFWEASSSSLGIRASACPLPPGQCIICTHGHILPHLALLSITGLTAEQNSWCFFLTRQHEEHLPVLWKKACREFLIGTNRLDLFMSSEKSMWCL